MQLQEVLDAVEQTRQALIGRPAIQNYFKNLSANLPSWAERYGLDTAETAELLLWACMAMESPSRNTSQVQATLMSGYADLSWTTTKPPTLDDFILIMLESKDTITKAYWEQTPKGKKRLVTQRRGRRIRN